LARATRGGGLSTRTPKRPALRKRRSWPKHGLPKSLNDSRSCIGKEKSMRISQAGEPSVCLSSDLACTGNSEETSFVGVNLPVKVEDRAEEDGPMIAQFCPCGGEPLKGRAIENRSTAGWLVFRIPRDLCPEGRSLTFRAVVDEVVLWQRAYRVVWRGRFPRLESTA
jgi:hypothetical protein